MAINKPKINDTSLPHLQALLDHRIAHGHTTIKDGNLKLKIKHWLYFALRRHENVPETTPMRAALVKLGLLAPYGDEADLEHVLPAFLQGPLPEFRTRSSSSMVLADSAGDPSTVVFAAARRPTSLDPFEVKPGLNYD